MTVKLPDGVRARAPGFDRSGVHALTDAMQRWVDDGALPGLWLRLIHRGEVLDLAVGHRDAEGREPMTADTLFRLYSMTKPMTSLVLFTLYEQGLWALDDPIAKHLPELADLRVWDDRLQGPGAAPSEPPRMHHLLLHSAGFAYGIGAPGEHPVDVQFRERGVLDFGQALSTLPARVARHALVMQPGERHHYSVAHDLQGLIAERLSGQALAELMRERLFEPLDMREAAFHVPAPKLQRLAALRQHDAQGRAVAVEADARLFAWDVTRPPAFTSGGGGVCASIEDETQFLRCLSGGGAIGARRIVSPQTWALMTTPRLHHPQWATEGAAYSYAGLAVYTEPQRMASPASVGTLYTGGAAGTFGWVDPQHGLIVLGMLQVLRWSAGLEPAFALEPAIYGALAH